VPFRGAIESNVTDFGMALPRKSIAVGFKGAAVVGDPEPPGCKTP
jgi:hypothetical protein